MTNLSTIKLHSKPIAPPIVSSATPTKNPKIAAAKTISIDTPVEGTVTVAPKNVNDSAKVLSKQPELIQLMQRPEGIALSELMKLTNWQAHSIRGWISGTLRKKLGLVVTRFKSDTGDTCYRIETPVVVSE